MKEYLHARVGDWNQDKTLGALREALMTSLGSKGRLSGSVSGLRRWKGCRDWTEWGLRTDGLGHWHAS